MRSLFFLFLSSVFFYFAAHFRAVPVHLKLRNSLFLSSRKKNQTDKKKTGKNRQKLVKVALLSYADYRLYSIVKATLEINSSK